MAHLVLGDTAPDLQLNESQQTMWRREAPQDQYRTPRVPPSGTRVSRHVRALDHLSKMIRTIHPRSHVLARQPPGSVPQRMPVEESLRNTVMPPPLHRQQERTSRGSVAR